MKIVLLVSRFAKMEFVPLSIVKSTPIAKAQPPHSVPIPIHVSNVLILQTVVQHSYVRKMPVLKSVPPTPVVPVNTVQPLANAHPVAKPMMDVPNPASVSLTNAKPLNVWLVAIVLQILPRPFAKPIQIPASHAKLIPTVTGLQFVPRIILVKLWNVKIMPIVLVIKMVRFVT